MRRTTTPPRESPPTAPPENPWYGERQIALMDVFGAANAKVFDQPIPQILLDTYYGRNFTESDVAAVKVEIPAVVKADKKAKKNA